MKLKMFKKVLAVALATTMVLSLAACGGKKENKKADEEPFDVTIDQIKLGEDYTDLKADLKFITHRTDSIDTKFAGYIKEFQKEYPDINIEYEGITNYVDDMTTRLSTGDWGDICMIPTTTSREDLPTYFTPLGKLDTLNEDYIMLDNFSYKDEVYGIPATGNVFGVVYNKAVFEKAGITELPKTPDEYLDVLQKIKNNTDAIPLYTNFAAEWTMTAWDGYIDGSATGDPDFANIKRLKEKDPFADRGDMTGPWAVYYTLYEAVARDLIEDDPSTTDWEGSKPMMNKGEIGTMALGSWAVVQMQAAGDNADDIAYMPFPISVDGKQYAGAGPDYDYGINVNSSNDQKLASLIYIKWLLEESGWAYDEGSVPIVKGGEYPDSLAGFEGVELVIDNPSPAGEETLKDDINNESELGINASGAVAKAVVEAALE
jgi:ABC-type glycerol-3-phosphate transport system substrate-binding protein